MGNRNGNDGLVTTDVSKLTPGALALLEKSLREVGDFGEVHIVVQQNRIRFVRTIKSMSVNAGDSDIER